MAVTIPSGDKVNAAIQAEITALTAFITANPLTAAQFTNIRNQLQQQLVLNLMAAAVTGTGNGDNTPGVFASFLSPATILAASSVNT